MKTLYPALEPYATHQLEVDAIHTLYVEECGNPEGLPVIFMHGGPGGGSKPHHRSFFDPKKLRIIVFDQRGSGRSEPAGETQNNNTDELIADLEKIRKKLGISKWLLFAGSWGVTLALLYAQKFSDNVLGMVLRGSFLARQRDLDWFVKEGAPRIYPDYWRRIVSFTGGSKEEGVVSAIHALLESDDEAEQLQAAREWGIWGGAIALGEAFDLASLEEQPIALSELNQARIELHYAVNHYFIAENQIIDCCDAIAHLPVALIHGRNDLVCTVESAWQLHQKLPNSTLKILPKSGHLAAGDEMIDALVCAADEMALKLMKGE